MEIEVLENGPRWVVCVKPRGVLSQSGAPARACMTSLLEAQLGAAVYPVHRLDREVGGVMVYAKTSQAAAELSSMIRQGKLQKEYLAVVLGCPQPPCGAMTDLLYHDKGRNKTYVVKRARKGVREARLLYRLLETGEGRSLVQIRLLTGRTHQIRAQFASRGLPLAGDGRYGGGHGEIQLWSARLTMPDGTCFLRLPERIGPFSPVELPPFPGNLEIS